ncbi:MAG: cation diffusion facilitator family transporter [Lachnospiraceae bacterium]|nr:cation diffusion facilitator family transporter [Lachnospiraceae bacterium]
MENRLKVIMKTSIIGIAGNVLMALFKIIIGTISGAISILTDGINNLADAGSSFITIVAAAFAGKPADKKHPFGYGRVEYLSSLLIAGIILYAGITSLIESVKGIINPETASYSTISLVVIVIAVIVKLVLALYTQKQGKKANSDSLIVSGKEALLDVVVSVATVVAAIIYMFFHVSLEAYLATVISLVIIKAGFDTLKETISKIIGEPAEVSLVIELKKTITSFKGVHGAYDLVLNNYGPDKYMASVHIAVDDTMTAAEFDTLIRALADTVYAKHSVVLSAVGLYAKNTTNPNVASALKSIVELAEKEEHVIGVHGFYMNEATKEMRFDMVVSLNTKDRIGVYNKVMEKIRALFPDYAIIATMDIDFNELV